MIETVLIQNLIANNEETFNQIYMTYAPSMVGFVHSITNDIELAKEITQDVFTSLPSVIKSYNRQKASFKTWLFTIAKNKAVTCIKRRNRIVCLDNLDGYYNNPTQTRVHIDELISILTTDEYQIINLRYIGKLTLKEVASVLELPLSQVKRKSISAHKKVKEFYEQN